MGEHDTYFQGPALLMYKDLYDMYSSLVNAELKDMGYRRDREQIEQMKKDIQSYLAECLYITAQHLYQTITEWPKED